MKCQHCQNDISTTRAAKKQTKFCSTRCRKEAYSVYQNAGGEMETRSARGAASELIVCADLLRRGFYVFRAVSPDAPCDLAILQQRMVFRVEVKTAHRNARGVLNASGLNPENYDILALVDGGNAVEYRPGLPLLTPVLPHVSIPTALQKPLSDESSA